MKVVGLINQLEKLEAKQAARRGSTLRTDPLVIASIHSIAKRKFAALVPGGHWSDEDESSYQAAWARMPPLSDLDRRLMARPWMQTSSTDELMAALRARMAGIVSTRSGAAMPEPPLVNPPARTAESVEAEDQAQTNPPPLVQAREDKLADYRGDSDTPHFESYP